MLTISQRSSYPNEFPQLAASNVRIAAAAKESRRTEPAVWGGCARGNTLDRTEAYQGEYTTIRHVDSRSRHQVWYWCCAYIIWQCATYEWSCAGRTLGSHKGTEVCLREACMNIRDAVPRYHSLHQYHFFDLASHNAANESGLRRHIMMQCNTMRPLFAPHRAVVGAGIVAAEGILP